MFSQFLENIGSYYRMRQLCTRPESYEGPLKQVFETQRQGTFVVCCASKFDKVRCPPQPLSIAWFNRSILGMTHKTERLSQHVRNAFGTFVTLVLSDFDQPMASHRAQALQFLKDLHRDSIESGLFNVLVECTSHAHAILDFFRGEACWIPLTDERDETWDRLCVFAETIPI